MASNPNAYEVVWPRGRKTVAETSFAPRPTTLEGKTIAELWNGSFRGDEIFPVIEAELSRRYPGVRFVSYREFESIQTSEEGHLNATLPEQFRQHGIDAAIAAAGC